MYDFSPDRVGSTRVPNAGTEFGRQASRRLDSLHGPPVSGAEVDVDAGRRRHKVKA